MYFIVVQCFITTLHVLVQQQVEGLVVMPVRGSRRDFCVSEV